MGILSGYKRFKKYLRTGEGYKLCSEWTKSDSVEMTDGSTLQESMDSIVSDVENTQNNVTDVHNELMTSLGGMTFGVDAAGRYGYIKAGADTVTPFKNPEDLSSYKLVNLTANMTFSQPAAGSSVVQRRTVSFNINNYNQNPNSPLFGMKKFVGVKQLWGISTGYGGLSGANISNDGLILDISFQQATTTGGSWSTNVSVYCLPDQ